MKATEQVASFFEDRRAPLGDSEYAEELTALERSLTEQAAPTLERLVQYHVELPIVLEILRQHRLQWVFGNQSRLFSECTADQIESFAITFETAAKRLELVGPTLMVSWAESIGACLVTEIDHCDDSSTELELSERQEGLEATGLAAISGMELRDGLVWTKLPEQIKQAILLLEKAAVTIRRRDWKSATDADTGKAIFSRGPRRKFVTETDCARALVDFLKAETNRALYDHVAALLMVTFPETCGRWDVQHQKRPRDYVKQLLRRGM